MNETLRALLASKLDDPDPVVRAHAAARLSAPAAAPGVEESRQLAASVRLMRTAARCPYRSTSASCGCFACGVAGGARRTPQECWSCVETYGVA
ncbi:hypothetical protein [Paludisphaera soli]|uniref:hypothetical protein n=1 Tax=Paludisphaera soli TaxID=2712865 RepID=UPI0013EBC792|nr:hypothetical protein [Paludisphaera soli]